VDGASSDLPLPARRRRSGTPKKAGRRAHLDSPLTATGPRGRARDHGRGGWAARVEAAGPRGRPRSSCARARLGRVRETLIIAARAAGLAHETAHFRSYRLREMSLGRLGRAGTGRRSRRAWPGDDGAGGDGRKKWNLPPAQRRELHHGRAERAQASARRHSWHWRRTSRSRCLAHGGIGARACAGLFVPRARRTDIMEMDQPQDAFFRPARRRHSERIS